MDTTSYPPGEPRPEDRWRDGVAHSATVLFLALFCAECWLLRQFTAEDAYIVLRYARNAAQDGELTFNRGEHVSALTSPLHAVLETMLFRLFEAALVPYKWLSFSLALGCWWIVSRQKYRAAALTLIAAIGASPFVSLWTMGGLETPILLILLTSISVTAMPRLATTLSPGRIVLLHGLAGLAFVARYDSVLFVAPVVVGTWWTTHATRRVWVLALFAGALIPLIWLIFATSYYGAVLPTSFHVKHIQWTPTSLLRNGVYISVSLALTLTMVALVPALLGARERLQELDTVARVRLAALAIGLVAELAYALGSVTAHMMFGARLLVPYLIPAALACVKLTPDRYFRQLSARIFCCGAISALSFQVAHTIYVYRRSLNGFSPIGEYRNEGVSSYAGSFIPALSQNASALHEHWRRRKMGRPPIVFTFAGGVLPYEIPNSYILEKLVAWPWFSALDRSELLSCTDYVHLLAPRHGSAEQQLGQRADSAVLVNSVALRFDGSEERAEVYALPSVASDARSCLEEKLAISPHSPAVWP